MNSTDANEGGIDPDRAVGVLAKRGDLVRLLWDGPRHVRDLQEELDVSRSTAYSAVRELAADGVAERTPDGYRLTSFGELLADEYVAFQERVGALCRAEPLLEALPAPAVVTTDLLDGAEITYANRHAPNRPVHVVEEVVQSATRLRGFSPVILPEYVSLFHDQLVSGALEAELLLERPVVEHLIADYRPPFEEAIATDRLSLRETAESLPFGLVVVEAPREEIAVIVYDEGGELRGVLGNDSDAAIEWARAVYREYREGSDALEADAG